MHSSNKTLHSKCTTCNIKEELKKKKKKKKKKCRCLYTYKARSLCTGVKCSTSLVSGKGGSEKVCFKGTFELGQGIGMADRERETIPGYRADVRESTLSLCLLFTGRDLQQSSVCS